MNRLAVPVAVVAAAVTASLLAPAAADPPQLPNVRIKASDYRVASGEQFIVRGRITLGYGRDRIPAPPSIVWVQAKRHGRWHKLTGARVRSNENGRYRCRVILQMRGKRRLRVHTKTPHFRRWVNSRTIKVRVR